MCHLCPDCNLAVLAVQGVHRGSTWGVGDLDVPYSICYFYSIRQLQTAKQVKPIGLSGWLTIFSLAKSNPLDKSGSHSCQSLNELVLGTYSQTHRTIKRLAKNSKSMQPQSCGKRRSSMHFAIFSAKWETSTANWLTGKLNTQSSCWPFLTSFSIVCGLNAKDSTLAKRMRELDAALASTPTACSSPWS